MSPAILAMISLMWLSVTQSLDELRPIYHPMPEKNWMNDPNGPVYYEGYYHLFFQYNPDAAVWGNMHWYHLISKDLVHWSVLPIALAPDQPYDAAGVFTGSITLFNGSPVILYTGQTDHGEFQCVAYPTNASDPTLVNWSKSASNPVIPQPPPGGDANNFRDPTTGWYESSENQWFAVVGCEKDGQAGALLYSSADFVHWKFVNVLYKNASFGNIWECPDFFPVLVGSTEYHVIKFSAGGNDHWIVGTYDNINHVFIPAPNAEISELSYGNTYASKSFRAPGAKSSEKKISDKKIAAEDRQIMWSWILEEDSAGPQRGWQGVMSLPGVVSIDPIFMKPTISPPIELQQLRSSTGNYRNQTFYVSGRHVMPVQGKNFEISLKFQIKSAQADYKFGVRFFESSDAQQFVLVYFAVTAGKSTIFIDRSKSGSTGDTALKGGPISVSDSDTTFLMQIFVDSSIAEIFAQNGREKITSRIYPPLPMRNFGISLYSENANVFVEDFSFWTLLSCWN